ncbi:MAG: alkaline phosphatase family protein [Chloroflexota bacterium]
MDQDQPALFASRLSRRGFVSALAAAGLSASGIELLAGCGEPVAAGEKGGRYLALIVLDGFRPDYAHLAPMPHLQSLAARGVRYSRAWVGQLESETPTGHATITSGAHPRHDGIIGFEWRNPHTHREVLDGWEQGKMLGQVGRDMKHAHALSIPLAIKQADPSARIVALSSEKVYAADAMGAKVADYVLFHRYQGRRLAASGMPGQNPGRSFLAQPHLQLPLPLRHFHDWDMLSTRLALSALAEFQPKALMINLPGADFYGHKFGGPATPSVMSRVVAGLDHSIGQIVAAYRKAGLIDNTVFVVTADHGMVPNDRVVDGAEVAAAVERGDARYLFHTGGTAKYIYLRDRGRAREVSDQMARVPGVVGGYFRPDGQGAYELATGVRIDPHLDAAYRYLLATFTGPNAPDVVAPYRENTIGTDLPHAYGNHGGLSWGVQHIPLVLAGPGLRRGHHSHQPARLVDVAPTVLHLLGLRLPRQDGVILADALAEPTERQVNSQNSLTESLRAHQDALIRQSSQDLAQDKRSHIHPPPAVPTIP